MTVATAFPVAYIDASVAIRILLSELGRLDSSGYKLIASELLHVECMRVLHRHRLTGAIDDSVLGEKVSQLNALIDELDIIPVSRLILAKASHPMPTVLGTLDAIHLATAQLWQERRNEPVTILTHDNQFQAAARALGMAVKG